MEHVLITVIKQTLLNAKLECKMQMNEHVNKANITF